MTQRLPGLIYRWYDKTAERYGLTPAKVAALVKKHNLPKRRILGNMAVSAKHFDDLMLSLEHQEHEAELALRP